MYKLIIGGFDGKTLTCILRLNDGAIIPVHPDNTDYQQYLLWLAEGNTPEPAEENQ
jgi:hypothetical protein